MMDESEDRSNAGAEGLGEKREGHSRWLGSLLTALIGGFFLLANG